jgi:hypothetical protein
MRLFMLSTFATLSLLSAATLSNTPENRSLIIYNSGIGLVHETRHLSIHKGPQSIVYPGIATTVKTDSVQVKLPAGVTLYSQQYRFDKIMLSKILQAHIGKTVHFTSDNKALRSGTLLAANPPVVQTQRVIESGMDAGDFIFDTIPDTLMLRPSLVWNVNATGPVDGELGLDYLLSNIRWKSDYVLNLHENTADLTGWITVDNRSGKRFEQIRLHFLVGDINRANIPLRYAEAMVYDKRTAAMPVATKAVEGYHLYSVPFDVTLADNEKTQIKFIDQPRHRFEKSYSALMPSPFALYSEQKVPVTQSLKLSKFSVALPGGIVRTYSEVNGTTVLLGETHVPNTPKDENVTLRLGTNFDIVAKNKLVSRSDDSRYYRSTVAYSVANHSNGAKTVRVTVPGVINDTRNGATVDTREPFTRIDGNTITFSITLGANDTYRWKVGYRAPKE